MFVWLDGIVLDFVHVPKYSWWINALLRRCVAVVIWMTMIVVYVLDNTFLNFIVNSVYVCIVSYCKEIAVDIMFCGRNDHNCKTTIKITTKHHKWSQNNQILRNFLEALCLLCCEFDMFTNVNQIPFSHSCELFEHRSKTMHIWPCHHLKKSEQFFLHEWSEWRHVMKRKMF